ncbi:MAG TPA: hypothetical protein VJ787_04875, partial [Thermoleophilia bacterium]|nr:hypothetical protein [Thermoleophilia bacterium]
MSRPKLLSVVTIPSGGWQLRMYISNVTQWDTPVTVTMAAGEYFVAFDQQGDDFVRELHRRIYDGMIASGVAA